MAVRSFGKRDTARMKRRLENSHRGSRWTRSRRLVRASQVDTSVVAIVDGGFADAADMYDGKLWMTIMRITLRRIV